jgi:hypothetical protein
MKLNNKKSKPIVEIRPSLISGAGNGVFVTRNVAKGEIVCFYDGEERDPVSKSDFIYSITNPATGNAYIGYQTPRDPKGVSQFINDGALFELTNDLRNEGGFFKIGNPRIKKKIQIYQSISDSKQNCGFLAKRSPSGKTIHTFETVAIRDIAKGEELYYTYGIDYWLSKTRLETDEPFTRIFCLLMDGTMKVRGDEIYLEDELETDDQFLFDMFRIKSSGNVVTALGISELSDHEKLLHIIGLVNN